MLYRSGSNGTVNILIYRLSKDISSACVLYWSGSNGTVNVLIYRLSKDISSACVLYWSGSNGTVNVLIYRLPSMGHPHVANCTGWRGGSTAIIKRFQPMTQVSPIWMNIQ